MKTKWKVTLGIVGVLVLAGSVAGGLKYRNRGIVTVQTGKAGRQDLTSLVTASGEIKPRNYINIGTNALSPARIVSIEVTEGQQVRKGQVLARLESIQPEADVAAQRAAAVAAGDRDAGLPTEWEGSRPTPTGRRKTNVPVIEISRAATKAEALEGLERWKARHPEAAKHLEPADVLTDGMRGRSSLWYRVRVNLIHVPEADRPPQVIRQVRNAPQDHQPAQGIERPAQPSALLLRCARLSVSVAVPVAVLMRLENHRAQHRRQRQSHQTREQNRRGHGNAELAVERAHRPRDEGHRDLG